MNGMIRGAALALALPETVFGLSDRVVWVLLLFTYAGVASMLPVWMLLQPRDYINGLQLFVGLGLLYLAVLFGAPDMVAPAYNAEMPADTPSIVPLLFVTIACGAISGFHGLVASGTTSKQLDKETDARFVGYFGAVGEGMLALGATGGDVVQQHEMWSSGVRGIPARRCHAWKSSYTAGSSSAE